MIWGVWGGLLGGTLTRLFESAFVARAAADEQRALVMARERDAEEVGRRADRSRARTGSAGRRNSRRS
jgi:hypothetical protein